MPVGVTVAETAGCSFDATDEDRPHFMEYYFSNPDPYRYIIQNDPDIPLTPDPGTAVLFSMVRQYPAAVCNTRTEDVELIASAHWKTEVRQL